MSLLNETSLFRQLSSAFSKRGEEQILLITPRNSAPGRVAAENAHAFESLSRWDAFASEFGAPPTPDPDLARRCVHARAGTVGMPSLSRIPMG
jgi:hypothetical protein